MWAFRQLLEITLRLAQVMEKALHEAPDFGSLEHEVARGTQDAARQLLVTALEALDRELMAQRDRHRPFLTPFPKGN